MDNVHKRSKTVKLTIILFFLSLNPKQALEPNLIRRTLQALLWRLGQRDRNLMYSQNKKSGCIENIWLQNIHVSV